jgi:hypothetical protein
LTKPRSNSLNMGETTTTTSYEKKQNRRSRHIESRKSNRKRMKNQEISNTDLIRQRIYDICKQRYGLIADPRSSVLKNVIYLTKTVHYLDLPRQPMNLKVHNLCLNQASISKETLDTLGLNLNYGVSLPPTKEKVPIDLDRLRRSIRLKFIKFPIKDNNDPYIPKLHTTLDWLPPDAPKKVEKAMDDFELTTKNAFNASQLVQTTFAKYQQRKSKSITNNSLHNRDNQFSS